MQPGVNPLDMYPWCYTTGVKASIQVARIFSPDYDRQYEATRCGNWVSKGRCLSHCSSREELLRYTRFQRQVNRQCHPPPLHLFPGGLAHATTLGHAERFNDGDRVPPPTARTAGEKSAGDSARRSRLGNKKRGIDSIAGRGRGHTVAGEWHDGKGRAAELDSPPLGSPLQPHCALAGTSARSARLDLCALCVRIAGLPLGRL